MSDKWLAVGIGVAVPLAIVAGDLAGSPAVALAIVAGALVVGWWRIPRFLRTVLRGLAAGGLAGVLVLGPGYRLAMRVVAILDRFRQPEFSLEGTLFLVVGIGLVFGAVTGGWTTLVTSALRLSRWGGTAVITVATFALLFSSGEVRTELVELGAGPWVNVPMFLGVTALYGYLADRWARPVMRPETGDEPAVIDALSLA